MIFDFVLNCFDDIVIVFKFCLLLMFGMYLSVEFIEGDINFFDFGVDLMNMIEFLL